MNAFTICDIKNEISVLINQYKGSTEEETQLVRQILTATYQTPGMYDATMLLITTIFERPETAETELTAFKYGMMYSCPFTLIADAMTAIMTELVDKFCFGEEKEA